MKIETNPIVTRPIAAKDGPPESVLPTGALRYERGALYQQANIIVHREGGSRGVGFYSDVWVPVEPAFLERILAESKR